MEEPSAWWPWRWRKLLATAVRRDESTVPSQHLAPWNIAVKLWDGVLAVVIFILAQFLITGLQALANKISCPIPGQILAMVLVFAVFSFLGWRRHAPLDRFYGRHLRNSAMILNKHMSIGFTIPFIKIMGDTALDSKTVGVFVGCFLLTAVLNTVGSYALCYPCQMIMVRVFRRHNVQQQQQQQQQQTDEEAVRTIAALHECDGETTTMGQTGSASPQNGANVDLQRISFHPTYVMPTADAESLKPPSSSVPTPCLSRATSSDGLSGGTNSLLKTSPNASQLLNCKPTPAPGLLVPVMLLCWSLFVLVGLPLRYVLGLEAPLATFLLFALWLSTIAIQQHLRSGHIKRRHPRTSIVLAGCFNPVLWTSLVMMAYLQVEAAISHRAVPDVLGTIQTNVSLADFVLGGNPGWRDRALDSPQSAQPAATAKGMGAGDIALAVLNAGLVSWGLKLYECRQQLWSRAGLTTAVVSAAVALANVACGPLLARLVGLGGRLHAHEALAFAARNVTIALGAPALAILGGDTSLNAAMVVANGILFQMGLGFGLDVWVVRHIKAARSRCGAWCRTRAPSSPRGGVGPRRLVQALSRGPSPAASSLDLGHEGGGGGGRDEKQSLGHQPAARRPVPSRPASARTTAAVVVGAAIDLVNDPGIVSAGVTIGLNSAAMGTAHLYETESPAAPFSALSMTVVGVMTVVFAAIRPLAAWVVESASD